MFNKKKVFVVALAVCLIAILSMGTLAWFTAEDDVTNKFYFATSEDGTDDADFSVDVYENVGTDGTIDPETGDAVYEKVLPGDELTKEVTVENTGSYDEYIRVTVTISHISIWEQMIAENYEEVSGKAYESLEECKARYVMSIITNGFYNEEDGWNWAKGSFTVSDDTATAVMYYKDILGAGETISLFDSVNIPEYLTVEDAADFEITIVADAVQTENMPIDYENLGPAEAAKASFEVVDE